MGSKPADQGTANKASAGAQAADASLARQADTNTQWANAARSHLFGDKASTGDFSGGTLSGFLDPAKLNVSEPTGTFGLQYNKAKENIAKQGQQARGSTSEYLANRGFGNAPSGFGADQERRATQAQTDAQGSAFTDLAGKSYQDALTNFWNANDALQGGASGAMSSAIAGNSAAVGNYANLYNTAEAPRPSALGGIIGGGLSAAGQVGAAAAMCPIGESSITLFHGESKKAKELVKGDKLLGIDGQWCTVLTTPKPLKMECVKTYSRLGRESVTSSGHTWARHAGGYAVATEAVGQMVRAQHSTDTISKCEPVGKQLVYPLDIDGSHTYLCDGLWSMS